MSKHKRQRCPCCGARTISEPGHYEICSVCNWEDDPLQRKDPEMRGGANSTSLAEARHAWAQRAAEG